MKLLRAQRHIASVFDLLGDDENDMTASLGYVLAHSPVFASRFAEDLAGSALAGVAEGSVRLQTHRGQHGITDVEIDVPPDFFAVIEAKRGPQPPSVAQLAQYVPVLVASGRPVQRVVALSNATADYAATCLPASIGGVAVLHRSWRHVRQVAAASHRKARHAEKRLLDEFTTYLGAILEMETRYSNRVYVVSLGGGNPPGWGLSWRDVVAKHARYFHPVGDGWPDPPNYLAFRFDGQLQTIHHVERHTTFTDPHAIFPEAPSAAWVLHYCYELGPAIRPPKPVRNGPKVQMAMRCWCMLDTLLTSDTITEAIAATKARERAASA